MIMDYRGFNIIGDKTFGQVMVKMNGQGKLPLSLQGTFTSPDIAKQFIDRYLNGLKKGK